MNFSFKRMQTCCTCFSYVRLLGHHKNFSWMLNLGRVPRTKPTYVENEVPVIGFPTGVKNMGGLCHPPPPHPLSHRGKRAPQNLMGGARVNTWGEHGELLKRCS